MSRTASARRSSKRKAADPPELPDVPLAELVPFKVAGLECAWCEGDRRPGEPVFFCAPAEDYQGGVIRPARCLRGHLRWVILRLPERS